MTNPPDFKSWAKTPRLDSPFVITEKIDGTNSGIIIETIEDPENDTCEGWLSVVYDAVNDSFFKVAAQSRNRLISLSQDNYGFAKWVYDNAKTLCRILGVGRHFGEWWGGGIQRGYGLRKGDHRFSLFNIDRYNPFEDYVPLAYGQKRGIPVWEELSEMGIVPVLDWDHGDNEIWVLAQSIDHALDELRLHGSMAIDGFMNPEGIVVYHRRSDQIFKKYLAPEEKRAEVSKR